MRWVLFAFTAPHAVLSWLLGVLSMATFLAHKPRFEGHGILTLQWREWFSTGRDGKGFYRYSTTLIRCIWFNPATRTATDDPATHLDQRVEKHERVHIRQFEDLAFACFWLGLALASASWAFGWYAEAWQPAVLWLLTWLAAPLLPVGNWITALLRHGVPSAEEAPGRPWLGRVFDVAYRLSEHERSAYAQTSGHPSEWDRTEPKSDG